MFPKEKASMAGHRVKGVRVGDGVGSCGKSSDFNLGNKQ